MFSRLFSAFFVSGPFLDIACLSTIDKRGIEVSNSASSQRTVITNTEFAGYYNDEVIFTLNKDETQTKKTTVDGELTVGKTKFVPMPTASDGLNIVILD